MKKRSVVLIILIILAISSVVSAETSRIQISMNGDNLSVVKAPILVNGEKISESISSFVHDDRTLVHIRFIEENSDAKVSWEAEGRKVIVDFEGKKVVLAIDDSKVNINDEKRILDKGSIPRLVKYEDEANSKTMVPLRFVAEALGFDVGWDAKNSSSYINSNIKNPDKEEDKAPVEEEVEEEVVAVAKSTVKDIGIQTGSTDINKLIIDSDKELSYTSEYVKSDNSLIINLKDSKLDLNKTKGAAGSIKVDDNFIKDIEYSQHSSNPYITRIKVNLKKYKKPSIVTKTDGTGLMICFENRNISSVTKQLIKEKEGIVIKGAKKENMKVMKLQNPERVVLDFLDSTLEGEPYVEYAHDLGFINKVRISQFSSDKNYKDSDQIVRIVLDVKQSIKDPNIMVETLGEDVVIYPEKTLWEYIDYKDNKGNKLLNIKNLKSTNYDVKYDEASKILDISIPSENIDIKNGLMLIQDGLVEEIKVKEISGTTKISVGFQRSIEYDILSSPVDNKVSLSIKKIKNADANDRLIVIDAGHGGKDPGARSVTGKREKDFNLILSKKFNEKLKSLGYNTIMTRDTDVFIDLYERPRIANENHADIFISIHANAFPNNSSIQGIEMLYFPSSEAEKANSLPKIMLKEMVKGTGAKNRGTIKRPKLVVLRETKMPAVLVEAGYLTNAKEEKLLFTESYQDKIVNSMVSGVEEYFEKN